MSKKLVGLIAAVGLSIAGSFANASAVTGIGGSIYATGGDVSVDVLYSDSGYNNNISLYLPTSTFIGIDNNPVTVDLGSFTAGSELVFGIDNGNTFYTGPFWRNPDYLAHANIFADAPLAGFAESWLVSFEDLYGGGDRDYNDAIIRVSQKAPASVPETSSLALLAAGLLGLGLARRKQA